MKYLHKCHGFRKIEHFTIVKCDSKSVRFFKLLYRFDHTYDLLSFCNLCVETAELHKFEYKEITEDKFTSYKLLQ